MEISDQAECRHCGAKIYFSEIKRKWVIGRIIKRGMIQERWHCGNDPNFPVLAHSPKEER